MGVNSFGLPEMKKDVKNRETHARTGNPALDTAQYVPAPTELQNAQTEAMQQIMQSGQVG